LKTGFTMGDADGVAAPVPEDRLRLTIPCRERLIHAGNVVEALEPVTLNPSGTHAHDDLSVPPSLRRGPTYPFWRVTLTGRVPLGLVLCFIQYGPDQHYGLRLDEEPPYPGEFPFDAVEWWRRGNWVPCPAPGCGAPLVWYEAGYAPGYRICARSPHHHAQLSPDGRSAQTVA